MQHVQHQTNVHNVLVDTSWHQQLHVWLVTLIINQIVKHVQQHHPDVQNVKQDTIQMQMEIVKLVLLKDVQVVMFQQVHVQVVLLDIIKMDQNVSNVQIQSPIV